MASSSLQETNSSSNKEESMTSKLNIQKNVIEPLVEEIIDNIISTELDCFSHGKQNIQENKTTDAVNVTSLKCPDGIINSQNETTLTVRKSDTEEIENGYSFNKGDAEFAVHIEKCKVDERNIDCNETCYLQANQDEECDEIDLNGQVTKINLFEKTDISNHFDGVKESNVHAALSEVEANNSKMEFGETSLGKNSKHASEECLTKETDCSQFVSNLKSSEQINSDKQTSDQNTKLKNCNNVDDVKVHFASPIIIVHEYEDISQTQSETQRSTDSVETESSEEEDLQMSYNIKQKMSIQCLPSNVNRCHILISDVQECNTETEAIYEKPIVDTKQDCFCQKQEIILDTIELTSQHKTSNASTNSANIGDENDITKDLPNKNHLNSKAENFQEKEIKVDENVDEISSPNSLDEYYVTKENIRSENLLLIEPERKNSVISQNVADSKIGLESSAKIDNDIRDLLYVLVEKCCQMSLETEIGFHVAENYNKISDNDDRKLIDLPTNLVSIASLQSGDDLAKFSIENSHEKLQVSMHCKGNWRADLMEDFNTASCNIDQISQEPILSADSAFKKENASIHSNFQYCECVEEEAQVVKIINDKSIDNSSSEATDGKSVSVERGDKVFDVSRHGHRDEVEKNQIKNFRVLDIETPKIKDVIGAESSVFFSDISPGLSELTNSDQLELLTDVNIQNHKSANTGIEIGDLNNDVNYDSHEFESAHLNGSFKISFDLSESNLRENDLIKTDKETWVKFTEPDVLENNQELSIQSKIGKQKLGEIMLEESANTLKETEKCCTEQDLCYEHVKLKSSCNLEEEIAIENNLMYIQNSPLQSDPDSNQITDIKQIDETDNREIEGVNFMSALELHSSQLSDEDTATLKNPNATYDLKPCQDLLGTHSYTSTTENYEPPCKLQKYDVIDYHSSGEHFARSLDQAVPGENREVMDSNINVVTDDDSLYDQDQISGKAKDVNSTIYSCDVGILSEEKLVDGCDEQEGEQEVTNLPNNYCLSDKTSADKIVQCFKWKYTPSCDLGEQLPACNMEDQQTCIVKPLQTCQKPIRLGLSRRLKVKHLHLKSEVHPVD